MTTYLRNLLWTRTPAVNASPPNTLPVPTLLESSPPPADDEDQDEDIDTPPAFPSLSSAQRISGPSSSEVTLVLTDSQLMPPPPLPSLASRQPGVLLSVPKSSSLAVPNTTRPLAKRKGKVVLAPRHSPLDWANLKASGENLRGVDTLMRIPLSVLKMHNKPDDAWSAFGGKVYNITPFLSFHPGGQKELMRVAGRDGTKLFAYTHSWVNLEFMLDACLVGFLVSEPPSHE